MKRIVVGISGATGAIYGIRLLEVLSRSNIETHLVISEAATKTIRMETPWSVEDVKALAHTCYDIKDVGADIASGSFLCEGMVVIPCAIKTLSGIAHSYNDNLLVRAADVTLKEKRKLVVVVRETPFHKGHLALMTTLADLGATILPPIPAFYFLPKTIDDLINHTVGKVLDIFHINHHLFNRWGSEEIKRAISSKGEMNENSREDQRRNAGRGQVHTSSMG
ncbi:MAG: UbiX family flavin prenyltransferase [Deltaproteobacteria bacterium]|nr:UbiX family flavin prenyltransferase [Deltaproteobacteria bacterium]MBW2016888.1 UbiX family flavin prenyltransferase [Deltaproteobacteria bacterium]MBW2128487.1 UbiX family flavin prenyltransferase [Deltaproteobacteria bacterium]MBW2303654.1 UbiX family flavin prenyltransferase [Deltaproteobacteria bacterium]